MNKREFLDELSKKLGRLPQNERDDVIEYYTEYFEDAGIENEQQVLNELGSADSVAKRLNAHYVVKNIDEKPIMQTPRRGIKALGAVILAIFAAPIALPLAVAAVAVAVSLAFAAVAVVASLFLAVFALGICGVVLIIASFSAITTNFATTILFIGSGFILIGLCVFAGTGVFWLSGAMFNLLAKITSKILPRNKKPNGGEQL